VLTKGAIEFLIEKYPFLPKRRLITEYVRHADRAVYEPSAAHEFAITFVSIEDEVAAADAARLLIYQPVGFAANRKSHRAQPRPHAAS
jgi:hypothetical protein